MAHVASAAAARASGTPIAAWHADHRQWCNRNAANLIRVFSSTRKGRRTAHDARLAQRLHQQWVRDCLGPQAHRPQGRLPLQRVHCLKTVCTGTRRNWHCYLCSHEGEVPSLVVAGCVEGAGAIAVSYNMVTQALCMHVNVALRVLGIWPPPHGCPSAGCMEACHAWSPMCPPRLLFRGQIKPEINCTTSLCITALHALE